MNILPQQNFLFAKEMKLTKKELANELNNFCVKIGQELASNI